MAKRKKPEAVILIGLSASGKSSYFNLVLRKSHLHISRDILGTEPRERKIIDACIDAKVSFVIDNTNVSKAKREGYLEKLKDKYHVVGCYFSSKVKECLERNALRDADDVVPSVAIYTQAKNLEQPEMDEGFDELYYISLDKTTGFKVEEWEAVPA